MLLSKKKKYIADEYMTTLWLLLFLNTNIFAKLDLIAWLATLQQNARQQQARDKQERSDSKGYTDTVVQSFQLVKLKKAKTEQPAFV